MDESKIETKNKTKLNKRDVVTKVMALILALLMLFSVGLTVIFYLIYYFKK